jgi:hypothetical protein
MTKIRNFVIEQMKKQGWKLTSFTDSSDEWIPTHFVRDCHIVSIDETVKDFANFVNKSEDKE